MNLDGFFELRPRSNLAHLLTAASAADESALILAPPGPNEQASLWRLESGPGTLNSPDVRDQFLSRRCARMSFGVLSLWSLVCLVASRR
jgi:hypothetical protein